MIPGNMKANALLIFVVAGQKLCESVEKFCAVHVVLVEAALHVVDSSELIKLSVSARCLFA